LDLLRQEKELNLYLQLLQSKSRRPDGEEEDVSEDWPGNGLNLKEKGGKIKTLVINSKKRL
jgi:hypothetical protein